ncbi:MFS transporter [Pseudonocardia xishanensis]|uniref:Aromatic acid/H+ symport family MFS transporter n=1 Tax=Pseudonocardia xishanensis TaxID=630995 RepID=A0ABP8RTJ4_9PSEU
MGPTAAPSVRQLIDSAPVSRFQRRVVLLCLLLGVADGFDALAIGYLLPAMSADWGVPAGEFGPALTVGLVGMLVGTTTLGPLADRIGRRTVLLIATVVYSLATATIVLVSSVEMLAVVRFVAGIGLGAVIPNLVAVAGEFMPTRARGRAILVVLAGTTLGGFLCGQVAAVMVPAFGWRSVYLVGVAFPLVLVAVALRALPESLMYLAVRGRVEQVRRSLGRIDPALSTAEIDLSDAVPERKAPRIPVGRLFGEGRAVDTVLLWLSWFATFVIVYFLYSWLPTLLTQVGVPQHVAILAMSLCLLANTVGGLTQGWLVDRRGDFASLTIGLPVAAVLILIVPAVFAKSWLLVVLICAIGFLAIGVNQALSTVTAALYPAEVRATGVGWAFGAGRVGSLVAPLVGGLLLTQGVASEVIFRLVAVPTVLGAITVAILVTRVHRARRRATQPVTA